MIHPIPNGTPVLVSYKGCKTCAPDHIEKVSTRILESEETKDGSYNYILLDGRKVPQADIIEVRS